MNHPADVDYIKKMVPNISDEIVEKQKTLQAGTCLAFGMAFKIPLIVRLKMPDPAPKSGNCDVVKIWDGNGNKKAEPKNPEPETKVEIPKQQVNSPTFISNTPAGAGRIPTAVPDLNNKAPNMMEQVSTNIPEQNPVKQSEEQPSKFIDISAMPANNTNEQVPQNKDLNPQPSQLNNNDVMHPYNSVQNYNANVDDGALNPESTYIPTNDTIVSIPGAQSFLNTETSLKPNITLGEQQPQIIIPAGQNVSPNLMEGFGNIKVVTEDK